MIMEETVWCIMMTIWSLIKVQELSQFLFPACRRSTHAGEEDASAEASGDCDGETVVMKSEAFI